MSNLYEITGNWKKVAEMLYEEEIDEQCIMDTLEAIEMEFEDKADGYAKVIKELLGNADVCKQEKIRLEARQKAFENRAKFLKQRLYENMKAMNKLKFKTDLFSFNIQANGGQQKLTVDGQEMCIRDRYYYYQQQGFEKKEIIKLIAKNQKVSKNEIYQYFLKIKI